MEYEEKGWEEELVDLIHETEQDKKKMVQRLESTRKAITSIENKIQAMHITLDAYRRKYGVPQPVELSETLAAEYKGMAPAEMLQHEADTHDEVVMMNRLVHDVVSAGAFPNVEQARSTLYRAVGRLDEFLKIIPGQYLRDKATKTQLDDRPIGNGVQELFIETDLSSY